MRMTKKVSVFLLATFFTLNFSFLKMINVYADSSSVSTQYYMYDNPSQSITVSYSGASANGWIGIYKVDTEPSQAPADAALAWKSISGNSGVMTFTADDFITSEYSPDKGSPLESGKYKVVLFRDGGYTSVAEYVFEIAGGQPLYTFEVASDMHVASYDTGNNTSKRLENALKDIKNFSPNSSCIVANGDSVDQSDWDSYAQLRSVLCDNKTGIPFVFFNLGNHEFFDVTSSGNNTLNTYNYKFDRFLSMTKDIHYNMNNDYESYGDSIDNRTTPYYEAIVNNNHFIFLANESLENKDKADLSSTQLEWLDNRLWNIAKYEEDQPVFVFLHQSIANTVTGTEKWLGVVQDAELRYKLNKYPNVFFFTGHTHMDLTSPNTMYQDTVTQGSTIGATMFGSGSVGNPWGSNGSEDGSQGLHIMVYKDKVVVKGRDFSKKEWISKARFSIDLNEKYNSQHGCNY